MSMDEQPAIDPRPPTERVPARRTTPLLVGLAALIALGVFVARPWDDHSPQPSLVALATAAPSSAPTSTPAETPVPTPTPTAPPPILPPPDFGTQTPPGSVSLSTEPGSPDVICGYGRVRQGARRLVSIEVRPPLVLLDESASATDIDRVGWRFQVETNVEQGVFERDWQYVGASRSQATRTADGRPAAFTPIQMTIRADELKGTDVFRVRLVVEWFTRNLEPAGSAEIVATRYQLARAAADEPSLPYCTGVLRG